MARQNDYMLTFVSCKKVFRTKQVCTTATAVSFISYEHKNAFCIYFVETSPSKLQLAVSKIKGHTHNQTIHTHTVTHTHNEDQNTRVLTPSFCPRSK